MPSQSPHPPLPLTRLLHTNIHYPPRSQTYTTTLIRNCCNTMAVVLCMGHLVLVRVPTHPFSIGTDEAQPTAEYS
ncbi:hypothetical protein HaLaN_11453 [Haematococcus lacustris]|uniref:Uncharacterized protein n=1 Tax=Haematococcus lacustris TaxID=44745 RepID=A0A699Z7Y9_HAELA|nr:hypothetical protein HaLaN_11453 [Haematococcus lacustris]